MGDTTTIWLLGLWEMYRGTGDMGLLQDLYPYVPRAVQWQAGVSQEYGLPSHLVCTYDILQLEKHNTTTFNGALHMAAMRAGAALATAMGDNATVAVANAAFDLAAAAMESLMWQPPTPDGKGGFYRAYSGGDNVVMADCLYGVMLALHNGLGWVVPPARVATHLASEVKYNRNAYGFTVVTGRTGTEAVRPAAAAAGPRVAAAAAARRAVGLPPTEPTSLKAAVDDTNDVVWEGGAPTWSYLQLKLGNISVDEALAPTRDSTENFRTRLADWWNLVGITTSGNASAAGWGPDGVGLPYVTSHYGFLL